MNVFEEFRKKALENSAKLKKERKDSKNKPLSYIEADLSFGSTATADAVALCILKLTCERCHSTYEVPNRHFLLRFRSNWKWSLHKDGLTAYRHLPHEVKFINDTVPACMSCYTSDSYMPPVSKLTEEQILNLENGEPAS